MSFLRERLFIEDATPVGEWLLEEDYLLQEAIEQYSLEPHKCLDDVPGADFIDEGSFSRVYAFNHDLALKVSNPLTVNESLRRMGYLPEDLREQFAVLSAMKEHLYYKRDYITTPEQYFVSYVPGNNFLLAQEYMHGWVALGDRMNEVYGSGAESWQVFTNIEAWTESFHQRVKRSLGDFALEFMLKDLIREDGRFHRGNVLVPYDAPLEAMTPLCIIDQPGAISP